jgi:elongation factor G
MMKTYSSAEIRNFAIVGHASSGKTMLSEAMLACGNVINRMGSIANGTTVSDYHVGEKQRGISIQGSLLHTEWLERKFNIIDTPGYLDFAGESLGALRVGDFALVVVHALQEVGVGTEQTWKYAGGYGIPKIVAVNAMDKERVDFPALLKNIRARLGEKIFPLSVPLNSGPGFNQLLDVLRSEVVTYETNGSGKFREEPAEGAAREEVERLHRELMELIAESDDSLLERFFEQGGLSEEEMRSGIHTAVQNQSFIPLFCLSAEQNIGVARLMDFIAKYGSSPVDRKKVAAMDGEGSPIEVGLEDPHPVLYVFKTSSDPQSGDLSCFRLYAGKVSVGMDLFNSDRKITERIGQLFTLNGKTRISVNELGPGDIGAVVKLKDTHTGNTLCSPKRVVSLPKVEYPQPNIHAALKLSAKGEEEKIATGLAALHEEDPTFLFHVDPELHQTVISGQGELHLQVLAERLKRRYKVHFELIEPRIPYRETIRGKGESKYRHKKQTGGAGQFAEVWMRIEPAPRDSGVEFTQSLSGQNVDRVFVPSVEKGVQSACKEGVLAGYPVVDIKVDFYDGKMHPVDSKDIAFQIAGKQAFREAFQNARPCLLEPIYSMEITVPEDYLGSVMGDLSSRRGKIQGIETDGSFQVVKALAPQKELYHYSTNLRSLTGGRGMHRERLSHYEEMPRDFEEKVIAESKARREENNH